MCDMSCVSFWGQNSASHRGTSDGEADFEWGTASLQTKGIKKSGYSHGITF